MSFDCPARSTPIAEESPLPSAVERRNADRQMSVMLSAKLVAHGDERPCRIQNISAKGAKIEALAGLCIGDAVVIEFRSDLVAHGIVRWHRDAMAGVEFDEILDVGKLLKRSEPSIMRVKPRPPRYRCDVPTLVTTGQTTMLCHTVDISVSGLKLRSPVPLRRGDVVTVKVEGLPQHKAKVIWCVADSCGLKLRTPFTHSDIEQRIFGDGSPKASRKAC